MGKTRSGEQHRGWVFLSLSLCCREGQGRGFPSPKFQMALRKAFGLCCGTHSNPSCETGRCPAGREEGGPGAGPRAGQAGAAPGERQGPGMEVSDPGKHRQCPGQRPTRSGRGLNVLTEGAEGPTLDRGTCTGQWPEALSPSINGPLWGAFIPAHSYSAFPAECVTAKSIKAEPPDWKGGRWWCPRVLPMG